MSDEIGSANEGLVSINRASAEELALALPELAPGMAEQVEAYRQAHGPFTHVDDLAAVEGVDVALLARLAGRLDLSVPEAAAIPAAEPVAPLVAEAAAPVEPAPEPTAAAAPQMPEPAPTLASERLTPLEEAAPLAGRPPVSERRPSAFWRGFLLVLLGGLLGVALTLIAAILWSGTVDYAPRNEVQALSRNLDTLYANQEMAWQRLDDLSARAAEVQRKLAQVDALDGRLTDVEGRLVTTGQTLRTMQQASEVLRQQVVEQGKAASALGERLLVAESSLGALQTELAVLRARTDAIAARLGEYEAFLGALRDLLIGLQPPPTPTAEPRLSPTPRSGVTRPTPAPAG